MNILQPSAQPIKVSKYTAFLREIKALHFIIVLTLVLLVLAVLVHTYGVFNFDVTVTHFVQSVRSPLMDSIATFFTDLGITGVFLTIVAIIALCFWYAKLVKSAVIIVLSLSSYPINVEIKNLVDRARPTSQLVKIISPAGGYSFPSGHAMITMTVYGCIAYMIWTHLKSSKRGMIPVAAGLLILIIGLSRIYLGVHWFSDVLGGWIAGIILLLILAEVYKKWEQKNYAFK